MIMSEITHLKAENAKLCEQLDIAEHNQTRNAREYARLCHENDKLRELVRFMEDGDWCTTCKVAKECDAKDRSYIDQLQAENAKLSELVRDMYACISHANEQDWFYFERDKLGCGMSCTVNGEACGLCALADRMRELFGEENDGSDLV